MGLGKTLVEPPELGSPLVPLGLGEATHLQAVWSHH